MKYFVLLLIPFVLVGCIKKFSTPEWDTELHLPLMNKAYYMYELEDSTDFIIENDTLYALTDGDIKGYAIDDTMNINSLNSPVVPIISNITGRGALDINEEGQNDSFLGVSYGAINRWILNFEIQNPDQNLDGVTITFENLYNPLFQPVEFTITDFSQIFVADFSATESIFYSIGDSLSQTILDSLVFHVQPITGVSGQQYLGDIQVWFEDHIFFKNMNGVIYNKRLDVEERVENITIDYPHNVENTFQFDEAEMILGIWNKLGFRVHLFGKLSAINTGSGETRAIQLDVTDNLVFDAATVKYDSTYSEQVIKDSIAWLLNIFPDEMRIEDAYFVVGLDQSEYGFAYMGADAKGTYTGKLPMRFYIEENYVTPDTIIVQNITSQNSEDIEKHALEGTFTMRMTNGFDIGASIEVYFAASEDTLTVFNEPVLVLPRTDESTYVAANSQMEVAFLLNQSEIVQTFANEKVCIGLKIFFDGSDDEIVVAEPQDSLLVIGDVKLKIHIEE
ncbi:MAG: hypothetical protein K8S56_00135 [Candidatus Cloacimonetes bacterium]|nr:hypothetical protein [Candidatus Cloacimonadota bacterium]